VGGNYNRAVPLLFGDFELRPEGYELVRRGTPLHLEPRVFELLAFLIANRHRVVSKQELLERLWRRQFVSESALTGAVRDLRRALGESGSKAGWIRTVHGRGFRFVGDVTETTGVSAAVAAPGGARAAPPGPPSLVVLPFEDVGGVDSPEYFADGMTDALINELARIGSLRVISRTSSMRFKGAQRPLDAIARELGVAHVVEGTVLRAGDRVRITVQLVRAQGEESVWAERYERRLADVLALQAEVAQAVAREVDAQLTPGERRRFARRRQVDPEVFLLDLEGRHFVAQRTEGGFRRAARCFQQALDLDPTFAPAHAGLAEVYAMLGNYGIAAPGEVHAPARAAAERALELDPGMAEASRTLALLRWQFEFDWRGAEAEYGKALVLGPQSALVRYWRGTFYGIQGRFAEGRAEHERALALDPLGLNVVAVMGWMLYFERRYRESLAYYRRVLEVDAGHLMARWFLGEALVESGDLDEGIAELEQASTISGRASRLLGYLGYALGRARRRPEARRIAAELAARRSERYVPAYFFALLHAGAGETAAALDELERALDERDTMLRDLKVDPPWERLRGEARYREILGKIGLAG
jgi:TolB-like protein/Tfp pilus assembly protein PilF